MSELVVYHSDLKLKKGLVDDVGLVLPVTPELHKYPVLLLQCFSFGFFTFTRVITLWVQVWPF